MRAFIPSQMEGSRYMYATHREGRDDEGNVKVIQPAKDLQGDDGEKDRS